MPVKRQEIAHSCVFPLVATLLLTASRSCSYRKMTFLHNTIIHRLIDRLLTWLSIGLSTNVRNGRMAVDNWGVGQAPCLRRARNVGEYPRLVRTNWLGVMPRLAPGYASVRSGYAPMAKNGEMGKMVSPFSNSGKWAYK